MTNTVGPADGAAVGLVLGFDVVGYVGVEEGANDGTTVEG